MYTSNTGSTYGYYSLCLIEDKGKYRSIRMAFVNQEEGFIKDLSIKSKHGHAIIMLLGMMEIIPF